MITQTTNLNILIKQIKPFVGQFDDTQIVEQVLAEFLARKKRFSKTRYENFKRRGKILGEQFLARYGLKRENMTEEQFFELLEKTDAKNHS